MLLTPRKTTGSLEGGSAIEEEEVEEEADEEEWESESLKWNSTGESKK